MLRVPTRRLFALTELAFVPLTFVCVGLCVAASCVFSGTEDSYTVTCGMPLPCLADAQKNNSGLYCLGKYKTSQIYISFFLSALPHKTVTQERPRLGMFPLEVDQNDKIFWFLCAAGPEMSGVPRIKTTATFKSGTTKCNLKRSQERLKESLNLARSGTEVATQQTQQIQIQD